MLRWSDAMMMPGLHHKNKPKPCWHLGHYIAVRIYSQKDTSDSEAQVNRYLEITFHMIPIYCRLIDVSEISLPAESLISSSHTSTGSPAARGGAGTCPRSISYGASPEQGQ